MLSVFPLSWRDVGEILLTQLCKVIFNLTAELDLNIILMEIIGVFVQRHSNGYILLVEILHLHVKRHDPGSSEQLHEFVLHALC